jgi:hypothetical protein
MANMLAAGVGAGFEFFEHRRQKSLSQNHADQGVLATNCSHSLRLGAVNFRRKKARREAG